jgi:hypothetical protein
LLVQPPLLPPETEHERVTVPSDCLTIENVLPDFE